MHQWRSLVRVNHIAWAFSLGLDGGLTTRDEGPDNALLTSGLKGMMVRQFPPLIVAYDETHFMLLTFYRIR